MDAVINYFGNSRQLLLLLVQFSGLGKSFNWALILVTISEALCIFFPIYLSSRRSYPSAASKLNS